MGNFLQKYKNIFTWAVMVLCLAALLCPVEAQAAGTLEVTLKSPTNPDHIFTGEEVYDLTVYLQGDPEETYYISYQVIDSRKLTLKESREPIAVTLSKDGYGELLLDLASVKGRDTFRLEVTVADGSGAIVGQESCSFGRVNQDSVLSQLANVRNGVLFSIDETKPGRYLYLKKEDHYTETLWVTYWITGAEGNILRRAQGWVHIPTKEYTAVPLNFFGLEQYGQCKLSYTVMDDTGNLRASGSSYFHHYGSNYFTGELVSASNKLGLIYANDEAYDLTLSLKKTDSIAETFSMRYTVTDSAGKVLTETTGTLDFPEKGSVQVPVALPDVDAYGIFTLTATATDRFGREKSHSFVLAGCWQPRSPVTCPW